MLSFEEAVARLTAYQDRLDAAAGHGREAYDGAFAAGPDGIGVHEIDAHHVVRRVSPGELALLGYKAGDMVGRPVWEFIVMQETAQRAIGQKLDGTRTLAPFRRTFRRADGTPILLALVDRYLKDPAGHVTGIRTAMMGIAT
jgi:PAS domain S-box-containing protein